MSIFSELDSKVFKNEGALSTEYTPAELPHRDGEIQQLARNIMPAGRGSNPQNTFLFGSPGIGKTAVVKHVFREFEDYSERVKTIYINCWDFKTATALLSEITSQLGKFVIRRGWARDEVIKKLVESIKKARKGIVVCLDEVDQLKPDALYDLLRINQYVSTPVGIVFISNYADVFSKVEPRIRSSLGIESIEFKPYTLEEMKDILKKRAELAFRSIEPPAVLLCANQAVQKGGDVRIGLQCLLKAGRLADRDSNKVKVEHVKEVLRAVKPVKPKILKDKVTDTEKIILKILSDGKKWKSGELYDEYKKLCKKSKTEALTDRAFRDYVNHLDEIGLIKIKKKRVGRSRIISKA